MNKVLKKVMFILLVLALILVSLSLYFNNKSIKLDNALHIDEIDQCVEIRNVLLEATPLICSGSTKEEVRTVILKLDANADIEEGENYLNYYPLRFWFDSTGLRSLDYGS